MAATPTVRSRTVDRTIDATLVAGVVLADLVAQVGVRAGADWPSTAMTPLSVLVTLAAAAPLLARRRAPWLVAIGLFAGAALASAVVPPGLLSQQSGATVVLAVYAIAAWSARRRVAVIGPTVLLVAVTAGAIADDTGVVEAVLAAVALVALPWAIGYAMRSRRLYIAAVEQRLAAAERDRDAQARHAVVEERARIARELHDVVAHHVSLIGVQAGAARVTLPPGADDARIALAAIEASSRSAVAEMGRLLGVLRDDGRAAVAPAPGLARLDELLAEFRAAGIDARSTIEGDTTGLDPVLDVCCYRVVEEALANVARHSTAGRATVSVTTDEQIVRIVVRDPGPARLPPPGPPRVGHGLVGMAERAALFAGRVAAGREPDGGFAVLAELPPGPAGMIERGERVVVAVPQGHGAVEGAGGQHDAVRVVVVDDQPLLRAAFATILGAGGCTVVGEAGDGDEAIAVVRRVRPDVVLMDVRMPGRDGLSATRELVAADPTVRVLVLTTFDLDEYLDGALRAGAAGFLLKNSTPEELVRAVERVGAGDSVLDPAVTARVVARFTSRRAAPAVSRRFDELTERERDALTLLARGLSNGEIAVALGVGEATAKTHVSHVLLKLGVRDRVQAVIAAYETGFVPNDRPVGEADPGWSAPSGR